jgi:SAM-dependent methyltransferase
MRFKQHFNVKNEIFVGNWVKDQITRLGPILEFKHVIDVGAGLSPFKEHLQLEGFEYTSHDFNAYSPTSVQAPGLQNVSWEYPVHDFNCDILEIPAQQTYSLVLCTEVLEHVPNPVAAFLKLHQLTSVNGFIIITCPFLSLMHQAPYWYSSGLSPYWFDYWAKQNGLEIVSLEVSGDYIDLMEQELLRLFGSGFNTRGITRVLRLLGLLKLIKLIKHLRPFVPKGILESGGFGTFVVLKRTE